MKLRLSTFATITVLAACQSPTPTEPASPLRYGDEISVCGQLFNIGTPVVLWFDEGGYNAYETGPVFSEDGPQGLRYTPGRRVDDPEFQERVDERGFELSELRQVVDQFVLHFDACGTSRVCFEVLQDQRRLSVHFMLDLDGTLYQTLDLQEQAWHARQANPRCVGVEIAHMGGRPLAQATELDEWYGEDEWGTLITFPERFGDGHQRTSGFVGRPARPEPVVGKINGAEYIQYDFTPEQYESLSGLAAGLHRIFPKIVLDAPRGADGAVLNRVLTDAEFERFEGVLGHSHVTQVKNDPGPAFDWEAFLAAARLRAAIAELPLILSEFRRGAAAAPGGLRCARHPSPPAPR